MGAMPVPMGGSNTLSRQGQNRNQGGVQGLGSQLYAGATNATGMPLPQGTAMPAKGLGAVQGSPATGSVAIAPAGLNVSPTPGSTNTGATNPTGNDQRTQDRLKAENEKYFGEGVGNTLTNYLDTGAGYNGPLAQQTIDATNNAMQQQINQQYGGLQTSLANAGLSPNSSASALASSQFLSNASAQENAIAAQQYTQMYSQSQQNYLSALEMVAGVNNQGTLNEKTAMGQIGAFLGGGVMGTLQYNSPGAGQAGQVSSNTGILGSAGEGLGALASIF